MPATKDARHPNGCCFAIASMGLVLLSACGGGNGSGTTTSPPPPPVAQAHTVGGSLIGLTGSVLVQRNNGGNDLAINANGALAFAAALNDGAAYLIGVASQPT